MTDLCMQRSSLWFAVDAGEATTDRGMGIPQIIAARALNTGVSMDMGDAAAVHRGH